MAPPLKYAPENHPLVRQTILYASVMDSFTLLLFYVSCDILALLTKRCRPVISMNFFHVTEAEIGLIMS